jgi:hypothetical protein
MNNCQCASGERKVWALEKQWKASSARNVQSTCSHVLSSGGNMTLKSPDIFIMALTPFHLSTYLPIYHLPIYLSIIYLFDVCIDLIYKRKS